MLLDYHPNFMAPIFVSLIFIFVGCSGGAKEKNEEAPFIEENCEDLLTVEESNGLKATVNKQIKEWAELQVVKTFIADHQNEFSLTSGTDRDSSDTTAPTSYYWDPIEHWVANSWGYWCECCNNRIDYDYSDGFVKKADTFNTQCASQEPRTSGSQLFRTGTLIYVGDSYDDFTSTWSKKSILNYFVEDEGSWSFSSNCVSGDSSESVLPFGNLKTKFTKRRTISEDGIPSEPCIQTRTVTMNIGEDLVIDMEHIFTAGVTSGTAKVLYHGDERLNTSHLSSSCSSALEQLITIYPDDNVVLPWL